MPVTTINNPEYVVWPGTRQLLPYLEPGRHIKQIADYPERIWCQIEVVSGRERAMSEILQSSNIPSYYPGLCHRNSRRNANILNWENQGK